MTRNVTIQSNKDSTYEVVLFEGNRAIHRTEYTEYNKAVEARESWLKGEGPELLSE